MRGRTETLRDGAHRNTMRSERSGRVILNRRRKRGCENFENIMRGDIDIVS